MINRYIKSRKYLNYFQICFSLALLQVLSCGDTFKMDYVPTVEEIKGKLDEFIIENIKIEGLYGNMDVDSMIFRYTPKRDPLASIEDILSAITVKAQSHGWKLCEKKSNTFCFNRFRTEGRFFSAEEVRVFVVDKNLHVYIGWVQADSSKPVSRFEDTNEWKFAAKVIWPKIESYLAQEKTNDKPN